MTKLIFGFCLLLVPCHGGHNNNGSSPIAANPFVSGCLHQKLPDWNKKRVCNSEDPPDAAALGWCRDAEQLRNEGAIPYKEIRLYGPNWDTAYFHNWLLQILLSEILDVPVSVETGIQETQGSASLYDPQGRYAFPFPVLGQPKRAVAYADHYNQDCTLARKDDPDTYEPCCHYFPEIWNREQLWIQDNVRDGFLQRPMANGIVGFEGIFVTKFTAEQNPAVTNYLGLQGEDKRKMLADLFLTPTSWKDYCSEVSNTSCRVADSVAKRPPVEAEDEDDPDAEGGKYYAKGVYTGHFRKTDANDCERFPKNCTGHVAPFPCGWSSYVEAQFYHLNVPMKGGGPQIHGGYPHSRLEEIFLAANATRNNLMLEWWSPQTFFNLMQGTDAELIRVTLPWTTQECLDTRNNFSDVCSEDVKTRLGVSANSCDSAMTVLQKLIVTGLKRANYDKDIPEAVRSPAYDVLDKFLISEFQLGDIFKHMSRGASAREAACEWAAANFDSFIKPIIPAQYPRALHETKSWGISYFCVSFGALVFVMVLVTSFCVYTNRQKTVFQCAQVEFLYIILLGGGVLSLGAIAAGVPASRESCIVEAWLVNVGYTLSLVPLIVKVAAINRIMTASKKMKRVQLSKQWLLGSTFLVSAIIVVFLVIWTILDPPMETAEYELTEDKTKDGITIVSVSHYCCPGSQVWWYASIGFRTVLLLSSTVLAFQSRMVRQEFNESIILGILIYTHLGILILCSATFFLTSNTDTVKESTLEKVRSILFSVDVLAGLAIYFVPKFFFAPDPMQSTLSARSSMHPPGLASSLQSSPFGTSYSLHPSGVSLSSFSKRAGNGSMTSDMPVTFPLAEEAHIGLRERKNSVSFAGSALQGNDAARLESVEQIKQCIGQISSSVTDENIGEETREMALRLLSSLEDFLTESYALKAENSVSDALRFDANP